MLRVLVYAIAVLVFFLVFALTTALIIWVVVRLLRFLFPARFSTGKKRKADEV